MNSPFLLTHIEHCQRDGFWTRDWRRWKLEPNEMIQRGLMAGLTSTREDYGVACGEEIMGLGGEPGLESKEHNLYDQIVHLAALADIVCSAIRKPTEGPWLRPEPVTLAEGSTWRSGAYMSPDGRFLRRIVLASAWNDDRHYSEARSWYTLGEVCAYDLPMQQAVIILGQHRDGKRHGYWSKGLRHPVNKKLRFRKRNDVATGFKSSWNSVWREDYDEITTKEWLDAMYEDGVLQDVAFNVDIPVPVKEVRKKIIELAARKLEDNEDMDSLPDQCLSVCDWPKSCRFRSNCHGSAEPSWKYGFVPVDQLAAR